MYLFSRFKFVAISSLLILIAVLVLCSPVGSAVHAAKPYRGKSQKASSLSSSCRSWNVVSSPSSGTLLKVTAISGHDVWAVGYSGSSGFYQTLTEHWNGTSWSIIPSPNASSGNNVLSDVKAASTNDVWAVGNYITSSGNQQSLIEHWDGTSWSIVTSPYIQGNNNLNALARVPGTSDLWAVGAYLNTNGATDTLVEYWNGTSWSIVTSPNPGSYTNALVGAVVLAVNKLLVVGVSSNEAGSLQTLTASWNGKSWSVLPSPNAANYNIFQAMARVPGARQMWAVGSYIDNTGTQQGLTEMFNGTSWSIVPINVEGVLSSIVAFSSQNAWVVGTNFSGLQSDVIEHWDGTSWNPVATPYLGGSGSFFGITWVPGTSDLWAVGEYDSSSGSQTLIEYYC